MAKYTKEEREAYNKTKAQKIVKNDNIKVYKRPYKKQFKHKVEFNTEKQQPVPEKGLLSKIWNWLTGEI